MVDVDVLEGRWARVRARKRPTYRIAGNFRGVLNFVLFVVPYEVTKISTHEFFSVLGTYAHVRLHVRTREIVIAAFAFDMALFCYACGPRISSCENKSTVHARILWYILPSYLEF